MAYKRAERQGFVVLHRARVQLQFLTDEEVGKCFRALLDFSENGTRPEFEGCLGMAFATMAEQVDFDRERWEAKCSAAAQSRKRATVKPTNVDVGLPASTEMDLVDEADQTNQSKSKQIQINHIPPTSPKGDSAQQDEEFGRFWEAYPRKRGKQNAQKAFEKALGVVDLAAMLTALEAQKQTPDWQKSGGQYIPYPAAWLNGRRWEDCLDTPAVPVYQPLPENIPTPTWL